MCNPVAWKNKEVTREYFLFCPTKDDINQFRHLWEDLKVVYREAGKIGKEG